MKEFLKKLLATRKAKLAELEKKNTESTDVNEVREIGATLIALRDEINDIEAQLAALDDDTTTTEENSDNPDEGRGLNPLATYGQNVQATATRGNTDPFATMEYRKAFMEYVQRGTRAPILETRADNRNVASDLGVLLPTTVIQEIIKGVEKVYGQLYSRVKKTNLKGGVKYPIGSFSATFTRISETGAPTERQKAGSVNSFVEFSYNIGEIRIAQTLLMSILDVNVFEQELTKVIVEAYVKAMDKEIMTGVAANNECEGILTEAAKGESGRIPTKNIITFTDEDMLDWKKWQEKLFAEIPLSMRALKPIFVMTSHTYEANIKTLKDDNNRPLYVETFNPIDGAEISTFKGKEVVFVEDDILKNFNDPEAVGNYFAMYIVPEMAYAINTNLEFYVKRYFDDEKNEYVDKALVINDGKVLDGKYIYLLKKVATPVA